MPLARFGSTGQWMNGKQGRKHAGFIMVWNIKTGPFLAARKYGLTDPDL